MGHTINSGQLKPIMMLMAAAILGCDAGPNQPSAGLARSGTFEAKSEPTATAFAPASPGFDKPGMGGPSDGLAINASFRNTQQTGDKTKPAAENEARPTATRRIVYNANINLVTEDLNTFESGLAKIVTKQKAYFADSDKSGAAGASRHGSWKVRVPAEEYDEFLVLVQKLGELVSLKANSQDVSEEYYDLDARQTAKKVEETRLLKHLSDSTGKLDEILTVERELSRVRGEIERMQGRLRVLADLTTLATVTIIANEIKGYVPPQAPTLSTKISRTFSNSLEALEQLGEGLLLFIVALAPWLPFIALLVVIVFWLSRRALRSTPVVASSGIAGGRRMPRDED